MTDAKKREMVIRGLKMCVLCRSPQDCVGCPYEGERTYAVPCGHVLLADALALLEAQMPRVMTLEEAATAPFVWLEEKNGGLGVRRIRVAHKDSTTIEIYSFVLGSFVGSADTFDKYFRCWTQEPSSEQMRDTPWEGDAEW